MLLANGTPMFRAGDEFMQTQGGNNNPYNQDNDDDLARLGPAGGEPGHVPLLPPMIALSKGASIACRSRFWRDDVRWYGAGPAVDLGERFAQLAFYLARRLAA